MEFIQSEWAGPRKNLEGCIYRKNSTMQKCREVREAIAGRMPQRDAKENGGLLSHLHFQSASSVDKLLNNGKLCKPMRYAIMCGTGGILPE